MANYGVSKQMNKVCRFAMVGLACCTVGRRTPPGRSVLNKLGQKAETLKKLNRVGFLFAFRPFEPPGKIALSRANPHGILRADASLKASAFFELTKELIAGIRPHRSLAAQ
jgi:hypothetical protein